MTNRENDSISWLSFLAKPRSDTRTDDCAVPITSDCIETKYMKIGDYAVRIVSVST